MAPRRRFGADESETRTRLVEATEAVLTENGYAAVSARNVAERAGLKPQLVHYYFPTMDALLQAAFRSTAQRRQILYEDAIRAPQPIKAVWELICEPSYAAIIIEFLALANHREGIREEIIHTTEEFRERQIADLTHILESGGYDADGAPPLIILMLMHTIATAYVMEATLGVSTGYPELLKLVTQKIDALEAGRKTPQIADPETAKQVVI